MYDFMYVKFKNRQNKYMLVEMNTEVACWIDWTKSKETFYTMQNVLFG